MVSGLSAKVWRDTRCLLQRWTVNKMDKLECEKCGGELGTKMAGDEGYDFCRDCNWITHETYVADDGFNGLRELLNGAIRRLKSISL